MNLIHLLSKSSVTDRFREAVDGFLQSGRTSEQIAFSSSSPPVKVARTLTMALERYGHLPIESIHIDGYSGCEFFRGELTVRTVEEELSVSFHWDCKWKAMEEGWVDYFGFPDQMRAAREFDYQCFRQWEELKVKRFADV